MAGGEGKLRIVFNGEIYNYKTLRAELEKKGYRFHSQSDTEVLLNLYADRGPGLVHALRAGIGEIYGQAALIQRCRTHEVRNVLEITPRLT
jgi:glucosamine 6-phosphate synthetase-like amidotransferase/phosphosugar isomerase protein